MTGRQEAFETNDWQNSQYRSFIEQQLVLYKRTKCFEKLTREVLRKDIEVVEYLNDLIDMFRWDQRWGGQKIVVGEGRGEMDGDEENSMAERKHVESGQLCEGRIQTSLGGIVNRGVNGGVIDIGKD